MLALWRQTLIYELKGHNTLESTFFLIKKSNLSTHFLQLHCKGVQYHEDTFFFTLTIL